MVNQLEKHRVDVESLERRIKHFGFLLRVACSTVGLIAFLDFSLQNYHQSIDMNGMKAEDSQMKALLGSIEFSITALNIR